MNLRYRWVLVLVLLLVVFCFQLWMANERRYVQFDGGHDFSAFATLGRQLIEYGSLPTFIFPGKTFDGPLKQLWAYFPGLVLGYQPWIPVFMVALCATLICLCCGAIARSVSSIRAGVIAIALTCAMDPYVVHYVFKYAYTFDVMVLLNLLLGLLCIRWVVVYRQKGVQPGLAFCAATGLVAGLAWYAHPTCAGAIGAGRLPQHCLNA